MPDNTLIQWTDATINFWSGCDKVSPGCAHCYAERMYKRWRKPFTTVTRGSPGTWAAAARWRQPRRIFTCSMSDFFHPAADEWRPEAWSVIRGTPRHTWQILTKRPERIRECLPADWGASGYPNVWLGVSAEYQRQADERIPLLLNVPAAVRFVSAEPLLGPLDITRHFVGEGCFWCYGRGVLPGVETACESCPSKLGWVIVGGESGGREARPMVLAWAIDLIEQCAVAGVAPFVKQLGSVWARAAGTKDWHGGNWDEWPADLRVREFPDTHATHERQGVLL